MLHFEVPAFPDPKASLGVAIFVLVQVEPLYNSVADELHFLEDCPPKLIAAVCVPAPAISYLAVS
jgi:hypothetical protein